MVMRGGGRAGGRGRGHGAGRGDRRNGSLRWGEEENRLLRECLRSQDPDRRCDPSQIGSAAYMRNLRGMENLWDRHPHV